MSGVRNSDLCKVVVSACRSDVTGPLLPFDLRLGNVRFRLCNSTCSECCSAAAEASVKPTVQCPKDESQKYTSDQDDSLPV